MTIKKRQSVTKMVENDSENISKKKKTVSANNDESPLKGKKIKKQNIANKKEVEEKKPLSADKKSIQTQKLKKAEKMKEKKAQKKLNKGKTPTGKRYYADIHDYLDKWANDKDNWSFNKKMQAKLVDSIILPDKVSEDDFELAIQYLEKGQGVIRNRLISLAAHHLKKEATTDEMKARAERIKKLFSAEKIIPVKVKGEKKADENKAEGKKKLKKGKQNQNTESNEDAEKPVKKGKKKAESTDNAKTEKKQVKQKGAAGKKMKGKKVEEAEQDDSE